MLSAVIDESTTGSQQIVAATTGRIQVVGLCVLVADVVTLTWKSGAAAVTGPMPVSAGFAPPRSSSDESDRDYLFRTAAGEALMLELSADVQVGGWVNYVVV